VPDAEHEVQGLGRSLLLLRAAGPVRGEKRTYGDWSAFHSGANLLFCSAIVVGKRKVAAHIHEAIARRIAQSDWRGLEMSAKLVERAQSLFAEARMQTVLRTLVCGKENYQRRGGDLQTPGHVESARACGNGNVYAIAARVCRSECSARNGIRPRRSSHSANGDRLLLYNDGCQKLRQRRPAK